MTWFSRFKWQLSGNTVSDFTPCMHHRWTKSGVWSPQRRSLRTLFVGAGGAEKEINFFLISFAKFKLIIIFKFSWKVLWSYFRYVLWWHSIELFSVQTYVFASLMC